MKKILLLGGMRYLIPVIQAAKKMGVHVITCDYLPNNPAHCFSDEYYNLSIIDKSKILNLAKKLSIDGIMSFAVDPGVVTAAYVAKEMGLPSPGPLESIEILQNKGAFREFLRKNHFNCPFSKAYTQLEKAIALKEFSNYDKFVIVKPVDAAGSKGVSKVEDKKDLESAIDFALEFSKKNEFIIEEFIQQKSYSSDSDSFSIEGNLSFITINNQHFDNDAPNPYTPAAYSWPSLMPNNVQADLQNELRRLISLLKMRTTIYNIEVREGLDGKGYIMETSPRGGGNRLAEMIRYSTNVDLITRSVQAALNIEVTPITKKAVYNGYWVEVILHSNKDGYFNNLQIHDSIRDHVIERDIWVKKGDSVKSFNSASDSLGTLVLKFRSKEKWLAFLNNPKDYVKINLLDG